jgi:hypothetical protein
MFRAPYGSLSVLTCAEFIISIQNIDSIRCDMQYSKNAAGRIQKPFLPQYDPFWLQHSKGA